MSHYPIDTSGASIRLFKSDFLEYFTHIHPAVVVAIWLPASLYFLVRGILGWDEPLPEVWILLAFVAGLFFWTFTEYTLHRFVFHYLPHGALQERIVFLFHGVHHASPQDKTRLVMPPVVSIPLALAAYGLFHLVIGRLLGGPGWVAPAFSGFIAGYLSYDMIHYGTHHWTMRRGYLKAMKRNHMLHHYKTPDRRFGVTSSLWDSIFGTLPGEG